MRSQRVCLAVVGCALAPALSWGAYQAPAPLTDTEVYAFLWELGGALQRCDAGWLERHLAPGMTFTFSVTGRPTETFGPEAYLASFRQGCVRIQETFDVRQMSVSVQGGQAVVRGRSERGKITVAFFLLSHDVDGIESTTVLVRQHDGGIKVQQVQEVVVLPPDARAFGGGGP